MADEWDAFPLAAPSPAAQATSPDDWSQFPVAADAPPLPKNGADQLAEAPWSSAIWPMSGARTGDVHFDPNAGLLGLGGRILSSAWSGITAPGDVYAGKLPIMDPSTGQPNPEMISRAADLAALASPVSPALRAGAMVPGELARTLGAPSAQQLKAAGGAGYDAARASGLEISGDSVGTMAGDLKNSLQSEQGIIAKTAPKTFAVLDELASPAQGAFATIPGLEAARRGLSGIATEGGTEGLAASHGVRKIDDFLGSLTPKDVVGGAAPAEDVAATLRNARANYAAAMRSNDLTGTLDRANTGILEQAQARAAAANSGQNLDNSIRQRVASLLQRPRDVAGFSDPEIEALNNIVQGSRTQNFLRETGNMFGGGGGWGRTIIGGLGGMVGAHFGGMEGAGVGAAGAASLGKGIKGLENALAERRLNAVDDLVRQRSPLYQQMQAGGALTVPAVGRNALMARGTGLGLLSNGQAGGQDEMSPSLASLLAAASAFSYGMGQR